MEPGQFKDWLPDKISCQLSVDELCIMKPQPTTDNG